MSSDDVSAHDMYMYMIVYCVYTIHTLSFPLLPSPPLLSSSQNGRSIPLAIAAHEGHLDTVKRLVEEGSNINHQNKVPHVM